MSFLDRLTAKQKETLIRLPYRVGLWISRSETMGGHAADEQEMRALSAILHGFAEEVFGAETIQYIISATLAGEKDWSHWQENLDSVPEECRFVVDVLTEYTDAKDVSAFKTQLIEIGEAVAMAFRERGSDTLLDKVESYAAFWLAGLKKGRRRSFDDYLSISKNERKALCRIAGAMGRSYS